MEKSLLETKLEEYLSQIEMPLRERTYAEEMDFTAELEDLVKPTQELEEDSSPEEKILREIFKRSSKEQDLKGEQPAIRRISEIYNGLGFCYEIWTNPAEKAYEKDRLNDIIKKRDFGELGAEVLIIHYDSKLKEIPITSRTKAGIFHDFYSFNYGETRKLFMNIFPDNKIEIVTSAKELNYKDCERLRMPLDAIEKEFEGRYLDSDNINKLMNHLRELKELVK